MGAEIKRHKTPEEKELEKKLVELARLESELPQRELDLTTLQAELYAFEARYLRIVGVRYAELDELEAQIAEFLAQLKPSDRQSREQAKQARVQAEQSAQATGTSQRQKQTEDFKPSESLKKFYREVAKQIHPDLTTDPKERERRARLMVKANRAYEEGDAAQLQEILYEWESSPESVKGEGPGAELVRVIRKIDQIENRLRAIDAEIVRLKQSDLHLLKVKVVEVEKAGRDLLVEMAARLDEQIADKRKQLDNLVQRRKV